MSGPHTYACAVGHSTGGGEVARFCGRHGTDRVKKAVLISAISPLMLKTTSNPGGLPIEFFDEFRANFAKDRAQFFIDVPTGPFFGFNRPGAKVSQGLIWSWWQQGVMGSYVGTYECTRVFSETDTTEDLKKMNIPVLLLHGDDDQIVPIGAAARESIKLLPNGKLKEYPGGPHALPNTNVDEINNDLLEFLNA